MQYRIERYFPEPDILAGENPVFGKGETIFTTDSRKEALEAWEKGADLPGLYMLYEFDETSHFCIKAGVIDGNE